LTICLAIFTSPRWQTSIDKIEDNGRPSLQKLTTITTAAVFIQLILGAVMRHTQSGLAIPDFPLAFGKIIPTFASEQIVIHFVHRVGAVAVSVFVIWTIIRIIKQHRAEPTLHRPALLLGGALLVQLTLGAFTIWTQKAVLITTAHVATGALILGTSLMLTLRAHQLLAAPEQVQDEGQIGEAVQEAR
jgi:cytochrome c oxidase assembly protein subunit 15